MRIYISLPITGMEKEAREKAQPAHGGLYMIDTLAIHGEPHEIVRECTNYHGGIMHSPECWGGKGGGR